MCHVSFWNMKDKIIKHIIDIWINKPNLKIYEKLLVYYLSFLKNISNF